MADRIQAMLLSSRLWAMLVARVFGLTLQLLLQILLGQFVGANSLGVFHVFTAWTSSLGEAAAQGQPTKLMRKISVTGGGAYAQKEFRHSLYLIGRMGLILAGLIGVTWGLTNWPLLSERIATNLPSFQLTMATLLIPACVAFACVRLASEAMKALGKNILSILVDNTIFPAVIILAGLMFVIFSVDITSLTLMTVATVSLCLTAVISVALIFSIFRRPATNNTRKNHTSVEVSSKETAAFWGGSVLNIAFLSSPFLIMPLYASMQDIGYFSVAFKLINLISIILILLASIYGPRFSRAFHDGDFKRLSRGLKETQILSLALFFPPLLALWFFCEPILGIFGEGFVNATPYLWILAFGQFINAATGLPGILLNMSGAAGLELRITLTSLILVAFLAFVLGPSRGAEGVALAFTAGLILKNCATYFAAQKLCLTATDRPGKSLSSEQDHTQNDLPRAAQTTVEVHG